MHAKHKRRHGIVLLIAHLETARMRLSEPERREELCLLVCSYSASYRRCTELNLLILCHYNYGHCSVSRVHLMDDLHKKICTLRIIKCNIEYFKAKLWSFSASEYEVDGETVHGLTDYMISQLFGSFKKQVKFINAIQQLKDTCINVPAPVTPSESRWVLNFIYILRFLTTFFCRRFN